MSEKTLDMEKTFDPGMYETETYRSWEESGAFTPKRIKGKKPFTVVMPPPNITGQLHMGHAMDCLVQDSLIRYHRMKGSPTLWLPGTDHASIATEVKIVERLASRGITKQDIGRDGFLAQAWEWKREYGSRITEQLRRMGASCDWSRERFTMDEGCSKAVREVFVRLYERELIYRGDRIINWCPVCKTALSDAEVEYEGQDSHLWHVRYPGTDGGEGVTVATTRPETMLGDTGVAVNPRDSRYSHLVGKKVILPLTGRAIIVVSDDYVDMEFGTGAVKMTPAHDPNDFEVAKRHGLEVLRVIDESGHMNENAGIYTGMSTMECRRRVIEELFKLGLLQKTEDYTHNVGTCYRCHTTVDPVVSRQWFVKMPPLARPAIDAVRSGDIRFIPERFSKTYYNWMENIKDWCISRQLWWGHRIPAWYCRQCGETIVSREVPLACPKCGSNDLRQDEDVLDTWFSSALWPFSTLGWPEQTDDLKYFYPTSTLVTGYDIIFFWVARMIFSGIAQMNEIPFDTVVIHGLVRDAQGRKMSKSLGNGIDPLEIINQYGADALRMSLCLGIAAGNDTRFSMERLESARNFANKIWNASRFVLMNMEGAESLEGKILLLPDRWILTRFNYAVEAVTEHFEQAEYGMAAQKVYDFAWNEFCDWYIELAKSGLLGNDMQRKAATRAVLQYVLSGLLRLLHPIMPFLTELLYKKLPANLDISCMLSEWPLAEKTYSFTAEETQMQGIMEMIRAIRNLRAEMNVQAGQRTHLMITPSEGWQAVFENAEPYFQRLASVSSLQLVSGPMSGKEKTISLVCSCGELKIPLGDLVDVEKERLRLNKEHDNLANEIARAASRLNNPGFLAKAPESLIASEKEKVAVSNTMLLALEARIRDLQD
jgi:valyl-tRNA synthetase